MEQATRVSVVLETDSVQPTDDISIGDCVASLARQDYPPALMEVIAVDGGKVPGLAGMIRAHFPSARVLACPGGTKFEQKNLGMRAATGDVIALLDGDCAAPPDWISTMVAALDAAPPDVAGVQGVTDLRRGVLSREVSAILYGMRGRREAERMVTDNVAFRRPVIHRFGFEHAEFGTVVDSLLLERLRRAGYRVALCEALRMVHSYPRSFGEGARWFLLRAWAVGYFMVRTRQLEPALRGSSLVRAAGLGWPLLVAAKLARDVAQVWQHRRRVGARFALALPLVLAFETVLLLGGIGALLKLPAPRIS